jgi:hypothetical protein
MGLAFEGGTYGDVLRMADLRVRGSVGGTSVLVMMMIVGLFTALL